MKILLDVKDDKVFFFMELLKNFKFVKAEPISLEKEDTLENIKIGVEELNKIKKGRLKAIPINELLNEL